MNTSELVTSQIISIWSSLGLSFLAFLFVCLLAIGFSAYLKIATVLAILRLGLSVDGLPSAFVTGVLALGLSLFVMYPTIQNSTLALEQGMKAGTEQTVELRRARAFERALEEWRSFLKAHAGEKERKVFAKRVMLREQSSRTNEQKSEEVISTAQLESWRVLLPAFVVTQLREAFSIGFALFLPFLVIELLVANVLIAVGLSQLSPALLSLPLKLLLFVLVDGWALITGNLVGSFN